MPKGKPPPLCVQPPAARPMPLSEKELKFLRKLLSEPYKRSCEQWRDIANKLFQQIDALEWRANLPCPVCLGRLQAKERRDAR